MVPKQWIHFHVVVLS